jgi:hypothetical protein
LSEEQTKALRSEPDIARQWVANFPLSQPQYPGPEEQMMNLFHRLRMHNLKLNSFQWIGDWRPPLIENAEDRTKCFLMVHLGSLGMTMNFLYDWLLFPHKRTDFCKLNLFQDLIEAPGYGFIPNSLRWLKIWGSHDEYPPTTRVGCLVSHHGYAGPEVLAWLAQQNRERWAVLSKKKPWMQGYFLSSLRKYSGPENDEMTIPMIAAEERDGGPRLELSYVKPDFRSKWIRPLGFNAIYG